MRSALLENFPTLEEIAAERERRRLAAELEATRRDADKIRARCKSLHGFIREAWHVIEPGKPFVDNWHIKLICAVLESITFGRLLDLGFENRVAFNVPPGAMKSILVSVMWQAWEWGPCGLGHMRFISTSYSESYVKRDTRKTRDLVASEWYQALWGDKVRLTRVAELSFANSTTGNREGIPFGSLTGGRGDRLAIDDPHSTETAESESERATTTRIFRESAPLRVNDSVTSAILLIMQRLHADDCTGVATKNGLGYLVIVIPMEYELQRETDATTARALDMLRLKDPRTEEGELYFPARFPRAAVERDKRTMGSYAVAGQFQQRPGPRGGGLFKRHWFKMATTIPAGYRKTVRAWDLAASVPKAGTAPDWTVGLRVSRHPNGAFYVEREVRLQGSPATVKAAVKNTADQDGPAVKIRMTQDPGQAGKDQAEVYVKILAGYTVVMKPATGSKSVRAGGAATQAEAGNIFLAVTGDPARDAWIEPWLDEICEFDTGTHDDRVDTLADAVNELALGSTYTLDNL